ncbi:MAG TPA: indole-3-glycerol phosphate synthase TrpC [Chloroflexota bacterium]|nr:indole-3-glycerol phosphate synthase TrpC [Chloroflexota bacterium]
MILDEIVANKQREVAERRHAVPLAEQKQRAAAAGPTRATCFDGSMSVIAEVKRRSPSAGEIASGLDPAAQARRYAAGGARAISVLSDERYFGGSLADLSLVRQAVDVPVLCKDFIVDPYQVYEARAHGADLVLLIVAALDDRALIELFQLSRDLGMTPLVEVHDQHELARTLAIDATLVGINNRDLTDFSVDLLTTEYLAPLVPDDVTVVSESGIAGRADVDRVRRAGARVVLVGEALMRASDPAATIRELLA